MRQYDYTDKEAGPLPEQAKEAAPLPRHAYTCTEDVSLLRAPEYTDKEPVRLPHQVYTDTEDVTLLREHDYRDQEAVPLPDHTNAAAAPHLHVHGGRAAVARA